MTRGTVLTKEDAKARIRRVFEYLKALSEHRNPKVLDVRRHEWNLWFDELPGHETIEVMGKRLGEAPPRENEPRLAAGRNASSSEESDEVVCLRFGRPVETEAPRAPAEIREWLKPGWDKPESDAEVWQEKPDPDAMIAGGKIAFDEDPARVSAFGKWNETRSAWATRERLARAAKGLFDRLHALYRLLEQDGERLELVLGDGLLSWKREEGDVFHPLLLQRVQLLFDPTIPELRVIETDTSPEFYASLLQSFLDIDVQHLRQAREEFDQLLPTLFEDSAGEFLRRLVHRLSASGEYRGLGRPPSGTTQPVIGRAPVLFVRSRARGFGTAIERFLQDFEERIEFCSALESIVGREQSMDTVAAEQSNSDMERSEAVADVLFGKPSNPEQLKIARTLDRHGSVLVQGPPGTGKSHTIANLIGHLLAQGKSVLVTSHTTKALRVLRNHLVPELRPLSVSVLDSDMDSRRELEESVQTISRKLAESNLEVLESQGSVLRRTRDRMIERVQEFHLRLRNAVADEYQEIVFGGRSISPADAAREIVAGVGIYDWIPGDVALGEPCPLSPEECFELYRTNGLTSKEDVLRSDRPLPSLDEIPEAETIEQLARSPVSSELAVLPDKRYWNQSRYTTTHIKQIKRILNELQQLLEQFGRLSGWQLSALAAGRESQTAGCPWELLLRTIERASEAASVQRVDEALRKPELSFEIETVEQLRLAEQISQHVGNGGTLGWLSLLTRAEWRRVLNTWKVGGVAPSTVDDFDVIRRALNLRRNREELIRLWESLVTSEGGVSASELGAEPERSAKQFTETIEEAFSWWQKKLLPLLNEIKSLGLDWTKVVAEQAPNLSRYGDLLRLMGALRDRVTVELKTTVQRLEALRVVKEGNEIIEKLRRYDRPEVDRLMEAIASRNVAAYETARDELLIAADRQRQAVRRAELLGKLARRTDRGESVAQGWRTAIGSRQGMHGQTHPPGDVERAWRWKQLEGELKRRSELDLVVLSQQLEDCQRNLADTTNQLIDRLAWANQLRRTGLQQRQALIGWLQLINRIGKGFGKRAPELRREARQRMAECRDAVPVWIMPLSRVVENFDLSRPKFDVVILDEASQCDVMALTALALARSVVVVGDDKQVSPTAIGSKSEVVGNLIRVHLADVPNAALYTGEMSMYDLAKQSFAGLVCLLEHFRCVPDIIQFSNHLSYEGLIKPLREAASTKLSPNVVSHRVLDGVRNGNVNRREALEVASLVVAICEHPEYAKESIGVISMLGEDQAALIQDLLFKHLPLDVFHRRKIACGNSAQFQGDERDVMFLSIVDSPEDGPARLSERTMMQQRFNVAASRARNQMWVVYSLDPAKDLKPGDLRRRLIEHALDPKAVTRAQEQAALRSESPFEKGVAQALVRRGFRPLQQWTVGYYRIDMAFPKQMVAIECDGDRYHPIEKIGEDLERQSVLERLGWRFVRIRGSAYYRDPEGTISSLIDRIRELGVSPESEANEVIQDEPEFSGDSLVASITRRAAEMRAEWAGQSEEIHDRSAVERLSVSSTTAESVNDQWDLVVVDETKMEPLLSESSISPFSSSREHATTYDAIAALSEPGSHARVGSEQRSSLQGEDIRPNPGVVETGRRFSDLDPDAKTFLQLLEMEGRTVGNVRLRELLGWDGQRYEIVKQRLIAEGVIGIGRGRGGSVFIKPR